MIRVMLIGNGVLYRETLAAALAGEHDLQVMADLGGTRPVDHPPADVAIVDMETPSGNFPSVRAWLAALPGCPVVALTTPRRAPKALRYVERSGVRGLVVKDRGLGHLADAVRRVAGGEQVIELLAARPVSPLTGREIEILRLMAEGMSTARIAADLDLTVGTVRNYLSSIVHKTGSRSSLEAVRAADRAGWL